MCLMSSCKGIDIWLEIVLDEMDYSDGISKFIFDPGVHRPHSTPKPLSTPTGRYGPLWAPLM
ncbi:hypothetical protein T08_7366 [Trichinella sp. T8]|nr:hypothetical protein T08_7964 [Trichinella sp. T8]KRZ97672.1 hypothetical protein T08_7366 [Trichinella sp. T8]